MSKTRLQNFCDMYVVQYTLLDIVKIREKCGSNQFQVRIVLD